MPLYTDYILQVKGTNLQTLGFAPRTLEGNWDSPAQTHERVSVPRREGTTRTSREPKVDGLHFRVTGEFSAATEELFEDGKDTFLYLLSFEDIAIRVGNRTDRQRFGTVDGAVTMRPDAASADGFTRADVAFDLYCDNPALIATTSTNVTGAAATDLTVALGTRRSFGFFTIEGATDPLLTYKHYDGTTLKTLQLDGSGDFEVDMYNRRVWLDGVRNDGLVTGGDFFAFDPRHGDWAANQFPKFRTSSGTPSVDYYKAFQ